MPTPWREAGGWRRLPAMKISLGQLARRLRTCAGAAAFSAMATMAEAATVTYIGNGDLDNIKSWLPQGNPSGSDEVLFTTGNASIQSTGALVFGNLIWDNATSSNISLKSNGTIRSLTLTGAAGFSAAIAAGGTTGDLIVMGTNATTNSLTFSQDVGSGNGELHIRLGATGNINVVNAAATLDIATLVGGNYALTKTGNGTLILGSANTYTGSTAINSGILRASAANALGATTGVHVEGGSLLITASHAINDDAAFSMGNGTLGLSGGNITENIGALTLTGHSVINLEALSGTNTLYFDNSHLIGGWGEGTSLSIWNWEGSDACRIYFGSDSNGLSSTQLSQISFYSDFGENFIGNAFIHYNGEISTVPEPETLLVAGLLLGSCVLWLYFAQHRGSSEMRHAA